MRSDKIPSTSLDRFRISSWVPFKTHASLYFASNSILFFALAPDQLRNTPYFEIAFQITKRNMYMLPLQPLTLGFKIQE